jgi:hypothetical protein
MHLPSIDMEINEMRFGIDKTRGNGDCERYDGSRSTHSRVPTANPRQIAVIL